VTEQEINVAIAEVCGVKPRVNGYYCKHPTEDRILMQSENRQGCVDFIQRQSSDSEYKKFIVVEDLQFPDYANDLNAMHDAEESLTQEQRQSVATWICDSQAENGYEMRYWDVYHATAAERAEAFLRTIGKWQET